jgi:hypothetical protein
MLEARTCHWPNSMALSCIGIDRYGTEVVAIGATELGGGR